MKKGIFNGDFKFFSLVFLYYFVPDEMPKDDDRSRSSPRDQVKDPEDMTPCPLCQEPFHEYSVLEAHVMQIHSVNSEGLKRLLMLMEGSHWLNNSRAPAALANHDTSGNEDHDEHEKSAESPNKGKADNDNVMISNEPSIMEKKSIIHELCQKQKCCPTYL